MNIKEYVVLIARAGNNYSAHCPDIDGCVATGKTIKACRNNFQEALEFHLDGLRKYGMPIPEPTTYAAQVAVAA